MLRDYRCDDIVLNAHAPNGERSVDKTERFYLERERVLGHFSNSDTKIL